MNIPLFDPVDFREFIAENGSEASREQVSQMTNHELIELVSGNIDWDSISALVDYSFTQTMHSLEATNKAD